MSGIDKIVEKIISQSNLSAKNENDYTLEKIIKLKEEQQVRFTRAKDYEIKLANEQGELAYSRLIANAKLEGRKKILGTKQDIINEVFDTSLNELSNLNKEEYIELLTRISTDALSKDSEILLNAKDNKEIAEELITELNKSSNNKVKLGKEVIKCSGGLIIKNGNIQVNMTFDTILKNLREELETEVIQILFEGSK